ncbi:MAG: HAD hydrolase-like protein [Spirochaetales bacterium]|nr:HAD hydrolase-like protein [Spirochaetales bacterium]
MNKLIIFDLDGTLADTREDLANAVNLTREYYKLEKLDLKQIITFVGNGRTKLIERSFKDSKNVVIEEACNIFSDFYGKNLIVKTQLYDGVLKGIKQLHKRGFFLAVLSNKPGDFTREIVKHFTISQYVFTALGGGDTAAVKPDPSGLLRIISEAENSGFYREDNNIWMVGDHYTDLQTAKNANVRSILCNYGFGNPKELKPDYTISSFSEILNLL